MPRPRPLSLRCRCPWVCVVALAVESGRGCRLAVRVRWQVLGGPLRGRDPVWFARCRFWAAVAHRGGRVPLGCSVVCPAVAVPVPVSPGGLALSTECGDVGRYRSLRCGLSPIRPSSCPPPSVLVWPLPCPAPSVGGSPVIPCPRVVLPAGLCSHGCVPVTGCLSPPSCRGPSHLPFPFPVPWWWGGGEVCGAPMAHAEGGLSGAIGGGFRGCRGGGGPQPRPQGGFPMLLVAWRPKWRSHWGWRGCR